MLKMRNLKNIFVGKPDRKRLLGKQRRRWNDTIKMDLREIDMKAWTSFIWLRIGNGGGSSKHDNDSLGSIKSEEFIDHVTDY
jgi:hypothetical protein